jgi:hypothetical protein
MSELGNLNKWINFFDENIDKNDIEFEQKTRLVLRRTNEVTKQQLLSIIEWRYSAQKHYYTRIFKFIEKLSDDEIREVTRAALLLSNDYYKFTLLCAIPGVGPALSAIILSFHNPRNYGLLEHGVWHQFFPGKKVDFSIKGYIKYLERLRTMSKNLGVPVRIVEQALLAKSKAEK